MSHECSKAALRRLHDPAFASTYFRGDALDIGAGPDGLSKQAYLWPLLRSVRDWDQPDGDAQRLDGVPPNSYGLVHSSHCLEHMRDPRHALKRWYDVLKPDGYLVTLVPDEDLYEQGIWPSVFNPDHKATFTPYKAKGVSWSPVSLNVTDLVASLGSTARLIKIELLHATWNPAPSSVGRKWDRTMGLGESSIEFVVYKGAS